MARTVVAWLFGLTVFLASFLLFSIQPMVGKMVLPVLGGTPGVWNTCMVFYQAALLAGYAYVHWSTTRLGFRRQTLVHLLLLGSLCWALPIGFPADPRPAGTSELAPALSPLVLLVAAAGLPLFLLATTSPLLQGWFSLSGHSRSHDPYFLYAASNAGSLIGLLGYPWLVEPSLALSQQSLACAAGLAGL